MCHARRKKRETLTITPTTESPLRYFHFGLDWDSERYLLTRPDRANILVSRKVESSCRDQPLTFGTYTC